MTHRTNPKCILDRSVVERRVLLGGVAASSMAGVLAPVTAEADTDVNQDRRKARYMEPQHVKIFYRVNRSP